MNQQELEDFAQFLRMAELANAPNRNPPSIWSTFKAKAAISIGMLATAIVLFRNFGHTLV